MGEKAKREKGETDKKKRGTCAFFVPFSSTLDSSTPRLLDCFPISPFRHFPFLLRQSSAAQELARRGASTFAILKRHAAVDHNPAIALSLLYPPPFAGR